MPTPAPAATRPRKLVAFGANHLGQLGTGDIKDRFLPEAVELQEDAPLAVCAAGGSSGVLVLLAGAGRRTALRTFGNAAEGRIGNGSDLLTQTLPGRPVSPAAASVASASLGEFGGAFVTGEGVLYTFGRNWNGENGRAEAGSVPGPVAHGRRVVSASRGRTHTAFVDEDGALFLLGGPSPHTSSAPSPSAAAAPVRLALPARAVSVTCGRDSTFVIDEAGALYSFGSDDSGVLSHGRHERRVLAPKRVACLGDVRVVSVACGELHAAAVDERGRLFMCGVGSEGRLGTGSRDDIATFVHVPLPGPVKKASCGGAHTAAILEDGSLWLWGRGRSGQLARGDHADESVASPRLVPTRCTALASGDGARVVDVALGADHTLVVVEY